MKSWLVYGARKLAQSVGMTPPATTFVGKRVIVGITLLDAAGSLIEQFQVHGRIEAVSDTDGILLMRPSGGRYTIPPGLTWLKVARPGEYRLRSTGEVVVDPDYLWSATMTGSSPDHAAIYKTVGFEGPFGIGPSETAA